MARRTANRFAVKEDMERTRVMVLSPHADDETFGMGGTILKMVDHDVEVNIIVVVSGEVRHKQGTIVSRSIRLEEFKLACAAYRCGGAAFRFTDDGALDSIPQRDIVSEIEIAQGTYRADTWYIPGPSYHQDHTAVFNAAMSAARPGRCASPHTIYAYETPVYAWNQPSRMLTPHVYENIEPYLEKKLKICDLYKSQLGKEILSRAHIRDWSIGKGAECGFMSAERFEIIRMHRL